MKIEARGVTIGYGKAAAVVEDVSLAVRPGEIVTIIGANGSGKSTILKALARYLKPRSGAAYLDGREILSYDTAALARKLAALPQSNSPPEDLTVEELVEYGRFPHQRLYQPASARDREVVERSIHLTGLENLRGRGVATLSGGERQRAWIALCLAQEPEVLLLDEPTTFLDICYQFEVLELIRKMNRELGITIVMVLHDLNHAAHYSDRIVAIMDKRVYADGPPAEIITEQTLRDVFRVRARVVDEDGLLFLIPLGSHH